MHYLKTILTCSLLIGLSACQGVTKQQDPQTLKQQAIKHVVVIGVDAMSPDGIRHANTPNIDKLSQQGSYTFTARGVLPTSSSANWKSMISSAGPEQHGVITNAWERDDYSLPAVVTGMENIFPTIFGEYRLQAPQAKIAAVYAWDGFGRLIERSALSYDVGGLSDEQTAALAADYLVKEKPELLFVHLDWVDHIGHQDGHKTTEYYQAVELADKNIGLIIQAAQQADMFKDTVFIITADHGGIGYGHGGETLDEIQIPFIIAGAGVKTQHQIKQHVYTYDTAATIAYILGITPHPAWIGKAITSAFVGMPDPITTGTAAGSEIAAPTFMPDAYLYQLAGGLFVDKPAPLVIEAQVDGAQIRYTLDGTEPTRTSTLYTKPVNLTQSATVKARHFAANNQQSAVKTAYYHTVSSGSGHGINYRYYEGQDWHFLPIFDALSPITSGISYQFRLEDIAKTKGQFGIQYTGWIKITQAGTHRFYTNSDDGSKLYIDGQEIVNNDGDHGTVERSGAIALTTGFHRITVDYFNAAGGAWLEVFHKAPTGPKELIKPELLFLQKPSSGK
ncbi:alkaline phosphatase family protein [Paraglaciecola sp.]|uniref:alkaline phosphatase family protein n=1 Tax=Paraglaciecola sp. TaxID=1920173 RepID=UPI0030F3CA32